MQVDARQTDGHASDGLTAFGMSDHFLLDHIFTGCDETDDGYIGFAQFVQALSTIFRGNLDEVVSFWFRMYDKNHDGLLTKDEFNEMLHDVAAASKEQFEQAAVGAFHAPPKTAETLMGPNVECLDFQVGCAR